MPSKQKRYRGDQFLLEYDNKTPSDLVEKIVACQTRSLGAELKCFVIATDIASLKAVVKLSTPMDFRGESLFKVDTFIPSIKLIRGKDEGLFKEVDALKSKNGRVIVDTYRKKTEIPIVKDEEGGYIFIRMREDPFFDAEKSTKFGRGYRRVDKIYKFGNHVGYRFIPFSDYPPQWASDIHGYDSFEDALEDIYPYQSKEIKAIKELYLTRPRTFIHSSMVLTPWQEYVEEILDQPPKYDEQERTFHWFTDLVGRVGKSMLTRHIEATRDDTLVITTTGKMSDLIYCIKDRVDANSKIKNIVFDISRDKTEPKYSDVDFHVFDDADNKGDTIKFMEGCVNGRFTNLKYEGKDVPLDHGLKVIVFSNSFPLLTSSSLDRWSVNLIKDMHSLQLKELRYSDSLPRITNRTQVLDFYFKQPEIVEYLSDHGLRTRRPKPEKRSRFDDIP